MSTQVETLRRRLRRAIEKHDHVAEVLLRQRIAAIA